MNTHTVTRFVVLARRPTAPLDRAIVRHLIARRSSAAAVLGCSQHVQSTTGLLWLWKPGSHDCMPTASGCLRG